MKLRNTHAPGRNINVAPAIERAGVGVPDPRVRRAERNQSDNAAISAPSAEAITSQAEGRGGGVVSEEPYECSETGDLVIPIQC